MKYALAIDIGASSGRHIVGWAEDGLIRSQEVYRFPNGVHDEGGHLVWDIEALLHEVKAGIAEAKRLFPHIDSLSIDTWGVDYVLMREDEPVLPVFAYRDSRTEAVIPAVHRLVPFEELYAHTGCQFQPFNSVYQLFADARSGRLEGVSDFLMIPEYLLYRLTGVKAKEFTNATTTGLINAGTLAFDRELTARLGLPDQLFPPLLPPGTPIGEYEGIRVILCATHDTGSAVEGIPMALNAPYISSGTWSLLGIRTERPITDDKSRLTNYSNEGGVGYNRYQKNIMGLWLVNELRRELCPDKSFAAIANEAEASSYEPTVDADSAAFLAPRSMKAAFEAAFAEQGLEMPHSEADYFRAAYRSLAQSYRKALDELEQNTGIRSGLLYIVGGGAKNPFLNRLTEEACGKQVKALPIEATALGNLKIQLEALNELS